MDRRSVLKNLSLVVGGTVLLPSCFRKDDTNYVKLKYIDVKEDQQRLVAAICEIIIPSTPNKPGAKSLDIPVFVLKIVDECFDKKSQKTFLKGLGDFNQFVKDKYGSSFENLTVKDQETALTTLEKDGKAKHLKNTNDIDVYNFYTELKKQTIFGYTTSKFFMTKEIIYELVPGRYNAHFPVKNSKTV